MYYIKSINENIITIANSMEQRQVSKEDLYNIKDVVVGYNRITRQVKQSNTEEFIKYIRSYMKLTGNSEFDTECELVYKIEQLTSRSIRVTIAIDSIDKFEYRYKFRIDYAKMFLQIVQFIRENKLDDILVSVELLYDLIGVDTILECNAYVEEHKCLGDCFIIDKVIFSDRTDLSKFKQVTGLFYYYNTDASDWADIFGDLVLDLSKLTFNRSSDLGRLFGGFIPKIIPPVFIGTGCQEIISGIVATSIDSVESAQGIIKAYNSNLARSVWYVDFMIPMTASKILDYGFNRRGCLTHNLILDTMMSTPDKQVILSAEYNRECGVTLTICDNFIEFLKRLRVLPNRVLTEFTGYLEELRKKSSVELRVLKSYIESKIEEENRSVLADTGIWEAVQTFLNIYVILENSESDYLIDIRADEDEYTEQERKLLELMLRVLIEYDIPVTEVHLSIEWDWN